MHRKLPKWLLPIQPQIARFTWPTWGPPGSCRPRGAPCWPHKLCYQGRDDILDSVFLWSAYDSYRLKLQQMLFPKFLEIRLFSGFPPKLDVLFPWCWHCQESSMSQCTWWRHHMETFSVLLALCAGNSPLTGLLCGESNGQSGLNFTKSTSMKVY